MKRRRYGGYNGQSGGRNALKVIVCLLTLALLLVLAGLLIGQRYLVYTDDGVRLELPFFRREQVSPDTSISVNVVQLPGKTQPEPPEQQPEASSIPEPENSLS